MLEARALGEGCVNTARGAEAFTGEVMSEGSAKRGCDRPTWSRANQEAAEGRCGVQVLVRREAGGAGRGQTRKDLAGHVKGPDFILWVMQSKAENGDQIFVSNRSFS